MLEGHRTRLHQRPDRLDRHVFPAGHRVVAAGRLAQPHRRCIAPRGASGHPPGGFVQCCIACVCARATVVREGVRSVLWD